MSRRLLHVCLLLLLTGCAADPSQGWSTASVFPTNVRTVAIPIATNDTFFRNVEFDLTDALAKEVLARTPYRISSQERADTILAVHIREVELDQMSKSPLTGLGEEVLYRVTIDFEWKNLRSDGILVARKGFTGQALFTPSRPSGERIDLGRFATVQQLARDIVAEMQAAW